jgi:hypothetical protein
VLSSAFQLNFLRQSSFSTHHKSWKTLFCHEKEALSTNSYVKVIKSAFSRQQNLNSIVGKMSYIWLVV